MLRPLRENLWAIDLPLKMPGGVQIGTRTTIIRLADGTLFMHCPGREALREAFSKVG